MLNFEQALAQLLTAARPVAVTEQLPLGRALGRVLASDIVSSIDVPGFDNSAMDGYALNVPDFAAPPADFQLSGRIAAGEVGEALLPGDAARIFTGAPVPAGANTVVMQEFCQVADGRLVISDVLRPQANIRLRGEDITAGRVVFPAGARITPQALGVIASVGVAAVTVFAPLSVALISTGSELVEPGHPLEAGKIYNSNRYAMLGLLNALGFSVTDYGIVPDNADATVAALRVAAESHDVVITSGGVSVGEEDHVKAAVQTLGQLDLWKIAIKPGKPFALGRIGNADFIGLPGNPVSCFVTFLVLARAFMLKRQGLSDYLPPRQTLPAAADWHSTHKRREFLRARVNDQGQVEFFPRQGSGMLTSMLWADGLADIPESRMVKQGELVDYWPLSALI